MADIVVLLVALRPTKPGEAWRVVVRRTKEWDWWDDKAPLRPGHYTLTAFREINDKEKDKTGAVELALRQAVRIGLRNDQDMGHMLEEARALQEHTDDEGKITIYLVEMSYGFVRASNLRALLRPINAHELTEIERWMLPHEADAIRKAFAELPTTPK